MQRARGQAGIELLWVLFFALATLLVQLQYEHALAVQHAERDHAERIRNLAQSIADGLVNHTPMDFIPNDEPVDAFTRRHAYHAIDSFEMNERQGSFFVHRITRFDGERVRIEFQNGTPGAHCGSADRLIRRDNRVHIVWVSVCEK